MMGRSGAARRGGSGGRAGRGRKVPVEDSALRAHVAQVAHELANALGIVQNYVAFLAEDLPPEPEHPARQDLPPLESAAARAVALVRDLQAAATQAPAG